MIAARFKTPLGVVAVLSAFLLSACSQTGHSMSAASLADGVKSTFVKSNGYSARDKECLARAMFFESKRSSRAGMIAVGTVVMNRKRSGQYPDTICGVVGQKRQFAPGVLSRKMNSKALPDVMEAADAVLKGERDPKLKNAMHFHTAGLKFPYNNMHYVTVAGGNAFYEKRGRRWQPLPPEQVFSAPVMVASAVSSPAAAQPATTSAEPLQPVAVAESTALPQPKPETTASQPILVAAAFPPAPKLGAKQAEQPVAEQAQPVIAASDAEPAEQQPVFALEATPEDADAIGQLLLTQQRPIGE